MPNCKNRTAFQFSQRPDLWRNMPLLFSTSRSQPFVKKKKTKNAKQDSLNQSELKYFALCFAPINPVVTGDEVGWLKKDWRAS